MALGEGRMCSRMLTLVECHGGGGDGPRCSSRGETGGGKGGLSRHTIKMPTVPAGSAVPRPASLLPPPHPPPLPHLPSSISTIPPSFHPFYLLSPYRSPSSFTASLSSLPFSLLIHLTPPRFHLLPSTPTLSSSSHLHLAVHSHLPSSTFNLTELPPSTSTSTFLLILLCLSSTSPSPLPLLSPSNCYQL